jgi:SAM-dependent methyltransferase
MTTSATAAGAARRLGRAARMPGHLSRGYSTAAEAMVDYRLGKLVERGVLKGAWLDCGCADGGYTRGLLERGAEQAVGIDMGAAGLVEAQRQARGETGLGYGCGLSEALPFRGASFDGVLLNEVLEHVSDEAATLTEIRRVLRPGGVLALLSPNRWFPLEGHGLRLGRARLPFPVPLVPWLPSRLTLKFMQARNYWPGELRDLVSRAGFEVLSLTSAWPVLEVYLRPPAWLVRWYRRSIPLLEKTPVIRRFGISTCILARRPE